MQFNMFEAGAAKTPPKKPLNPSIGYPSNGDLSHGEAPTQLGAYWVYQLSEEFTALLKDNGFEPSPDDLHQLSKFFKNYKTAMTEIKEVAVEAGSGAKSVLADMRQTQKEMVALKAGTAEDLEKTRNDLEDTRNALSEVNSVLDGARAYTQEFNQYQVNLDASKSQIQTLLTQNSSLEGEIKKDLNEIAKKQGAISVMEDHVVTVRSEIDTINSTLTQKAEDVAKALSSVNAADKQMQARLTQAGAAVETMKSLKLEVSSLRDETVDTVETVRSLGKQATDAVDAGIADMKGVADAVGRDKEEAKSYRDQAQTAAKSAQASAEQAKHIAWNDVQGKPTTFTPTMHKHEISDVAGIEEALKKASNRATSYVIETWGDGAKWYRKYSSGWIEQGGTFQSSSSGEAIVSFYKPFSAIPTVIVTPTDSSNTSYYPRWACFGKRRDKTNFTVHIVEGGDKVSWFACGF